jgi:putative Mn2+ efflux pump MntP
MPRHELNPFALFSGAIFCGLGVAYLVDEWTWVDVSGGWIAAFLLIGLGVAGIASAVGRARRRTPNDHRAQRTDA